MKKAKKEKRVVAPALTAFAKAAIRAKVPLRVGKSALKNEYRDSLSLHAQWKHTESVDLDLHFLEAEPNSPRWDYGVGVECKGEEFVFWVEPHPASSTGEVAKVTRKAKWLREKLSSDAFADLDHLTRRTSAAGYKPLQWVFSGELRIVPGSKEARALAQAGIAFPSRHIKLPV